MRKLFLFISCLFVNFTAFAQTDLPAPQQLSVKVNLNYQHSNENGSIDNHSIKDTLKLAVDKPQWVEVQDAPLGSSHQVLLLGKIEKADTKEAIIKFTVLTMDKEPRIISAPKMIVEYGQKAQLAINEDGQKLQLNVVATAVHG